MSKSTGLNQTGHQPKWANSPAIVSSFQKGRYALEELVCTFFHQRLKSHKSLLTNYKQLLKTQKGVQIEWIN
jgi:hypothetical protein